MKRHKKIDETGSMALSDHLRELRNRLIFCIVCLVISFLAGLHFAPKLVEQLTDMGLCPARP